MWILVHVRPSQLVSVAVSSKRSSVVLHHSTSILVVRVVVRWTQLQNSIIIYRSSPLFSLVQCLSWVDRRSESHSLVDYEGLIQVCSAQGDVVCGYGRVPREVSFRRCNSGVKGLLLRWLCGSSWENRTCGTTFLKWGRV